MKIITYDTSFKLLEQLESTWPIGKVLLFDIETTGLKKETSYVYLIGCAYYENGGFKIKQFLANSALDEQKIINEFLLFASNFGVVVHFNGDRFDIPYINYKADFYGLDFNLNSLESFDIYKNAKVLKGLLGLDRMNQTSIEKFLNIHREDKYDGGKLIPIYFEYEISGDKKLEELLLLHNHDDIEGMFKIMPILNYLDILDGKFEFDNYEICQNTLILNFSLKNTIVKCFEKRISSDINLFAEGNLLQVNINIFDGEVHLPISDYQNYYYLPEEDKIVHKSVAQYVDKNHKKKATKKNCYLKKSGKFLPQKDKHFEPCYMLENNKYFTYFEYNDNIINNKEIIKQYVLDFIK